MSNASDRAKGIVEKIGGTIKKNVGKVIGNEQMEAEGKARELAGDARIEAAKARERTKSEVKTVAEPEGEARQKA